VLELERISKRYRHGAQHEEVLSEVSMEVHEREVVAVWGPRNSGRSTLLRIAAAIEAPDSGVVRFRSRQLTPGSGAIAGGIAYCQPTLRSPEGRLVLEELIAAQLALGVRPSGARARASEALERTGSLGCQGRRPCELNRAEAVRAAIARGLLQEPSLLVVDEPTTGVEPLERDRILELLRSLTQEGVAILMSLDKGIGLFCADRALALSEGRLRGHLSPEVAEVLPLRVPARASG
jgi:putative ABC transport system ATP-binding protein